MAAGLNHMLLGARKKETFFATDFRDDAIGQAPSGWTSRYIQSFTPTVQLSSGSFSGRALRIALTSGQFGFYSYDAVPLTAKAEVLWRFRRLEAMENLQTFGGAAIAAPLTQSTAVQQARARATSATTMQIIQVNQAGATASTASQDASTQSQFWWMRFNYQGTTARVKFWKSGSAEPASWSIDRTVASLPAGLVGILVFSVNPDFEVDYFAVDVSAQTIPLPV